MRVIIARSELKPAEFADPHLFVHKDKPVRAAGGRAAPVSLKRRHQSSRGATTDGAKPSIADSRHAKSDDADAAPARRPNRAP